MQFRFRCYRTPRITARRTGEDSVLPGGRQGREAILDDLLQGGAAAA